MIKLYTKFCFLLFFFTVSLCGFSAGTTPVSIDSVDFTRVQHKKVRKLITHQKQFGIRTFDDIHPVCYSKPDSSKYHVYTKSQLIRQNIDIVWNTITELSPNDEFDGRIVKFGLLYSKRYNNLFYHNEAKRGMEEGQIMFFNLRVLSGIKNLAVAIEVTRKDDDLKTVEYCYVDHGNTEGTQQITLKPTPEGYTEITQLTRYKCNSRFRNHGLYSFFHNRIVKEFFNNIKVRSETGSESLVSN